MYQHNCEWLWKWRREDHLYREEITSKNLVSSENLNMVSILEQQLFPCIFLISLLHYADYTQLYISFNFNDIAIYINTEFSSMRISSTQVRPEISQKSSVMLFGQNDNDKYCDSRRICQTVRRTKYFEALTGNRF